MEGSKFRISDPRLSPHLLRCFRPWPSALEAALRELDIDATHIPSWLAHMVYPKRVYGCTVHRIYNESTVCVSPLL